LFIGYLLYLLIKCVISVLDFGVLVGAFSDFGRADTGKPVQILCDFCDFAPILEFLGLI